MNHVQNSGRRTRGCGCGAATHASSSSCGCGGAPESCCAACGGLQTLCRPRFFAGQLLTDTDLGALTSYLVDKQRLHNRYLHGPGVVCGLQVECDGCGPGVLVRPGYALDPCGNDIVLPETVSLDIAAMAKACTPDLVAGDCDPPRHPTATGCDDREQVWCLWVRYLEQPTRPRTPLGGQAAGGCGCGGSSGGCGCGGSSSGCGCGSRGGGSSERGPRTTGTSGSAGSRATTCGCSPPPRTTGAPADCQPSRVCESLEFGVAPKDAGCGTLESAVEGSFPAKVLECITRLRPLLSAGMSSAMQTSAASLIAGGQVGLRRDGRDAVCQLYANVVALYQTDPLRSRCVLPDELQTIDCSPQDAKESDDQYRARLALGLHRLLMLVILYLRDCLCAALLPPCPGEVCDDRLVLACITVRDGKVVDICNFACRRYAGSFVNREYWLPIGPVLSMLAAKACCFPLALPRAVERMTHDDDLAHAPQRTARLDRYAHVVSALRSDNWALARLWRARAEQAVGKLRPAVVLDRVEDRLQATSAAVRLAPLLHVPVDDAAQRLEKKGVQVSVVEVAERADGLAFDMIPRTARGGTATLYTRGGVVVGVRGTEPLTGGGGR